MLSKFISSLAYKLVLCCFVLFAGGSKREHFLWNVDGEGRGAFKSNAECLVFWTTSMKKQEEEKAWKKVHYRHSRPTPFRTCKPRAHLFASRLQTTIWSETVSSRCISMYTHAHARTLFYKCFILPLIFGRMIWFDNKNKKHTQARKFSPVSDVSELFCRVARPLYRSVCESSGLGQEGHANPVHHPHGSNGAQKQLHHHHSKTCHERKT